MASNLTFSTNSPVYYYYNTGNGGEVDLDLDDLDYRLRHDWPWTLTLCLMYGIVFILGLVGNFLVVCVVLRAPHMRTVKNLFILNLALADLLVIFFCLPGVLIQNIFQYWILGRFTCKNMTFIQTTTIGASIFSLVSISFERFLAIWYPLRAPLRRQTARICITLIWIISIILCIPCTFIYDIDHQGQCSTTGYWPFFLSSQIYSMIFFFGFFILPGVVIFICFIFIFIRLCHRHVPQDSLTSSMSNSQSSVRSIHRRMNLSVVRMLLIIILLFFISWTPIYLCMFWKRKIKFGTGSNEEKYYKLIQPIVNWIAIANSCINPLIYNWMNEKFRIAFKNLCCKRGLHGKKWSPELGLNSYEINNPMVTYNRRSTTGGGHVQIGGGHSQSAASVYYPPPGSCPFIESSNGQNHQQKPINSASNNSPTCITNELGQKKSGNPAAAAGESDGSGESKKSCSICSTIENNINTTTTITTISTIQVRFGN